MTKSKKISLLFLASTIFFSTILFPSTFKSSAKELINKKLSRSQRTYQNQEIIKGIFSWSSSQTLETNREDTYHWVDKLQINEIYQSGLFRISTEERVKFISDLKKQ